jgi:peptidyl-prolyl cis-trans isomerase B (cyclophilin B)
MRLQKKIYGGLVALVLVGALLLSSCTTQNRSSAETGTITGTAETSTQAQASSVAPASDANSQFSNLPRLDGEAIVELTVKGKPIKILVNGMDAPLTAGNFVDLVNQGIYNGSAFHRVVRQPQPFVVQGGDPQSKDSNFPVNQLGTGSFIDPATGQPRYIPLEIKPEDAEQPVYGQTLESAGITDPPKLRHTRGAVAMARSNLPDSASAQFYITLADLDFLDGNYAVFGYVTEGMEVVDQIQQGDRITVAKVSSGLNNLKPGS